MFRLVIRRVQYVLKMQDDVNLESKWEYMLHARLTMDAFAWSMVIEGGRIYLIRIASIITSSPPPEKECEKCDREKSSNSNLQNIEVSQRCWTNHKT